MTSEKAYVEVLRLLCVCFTEFVNNARAESKADIIPDEEFNNLFSNVKDLLQLNSELLHDFEDRIENWDTRKKIADVIVKKGPFLKLYSVYSRNFSAMMTKYEECCKKYPKFGKVVQDFEATPACKQLRLSHFLLKPIQRLPQYKMLLEDYLKHIDAGSEGRKLLSSIRQVKR